VSASENTLAPPAVLGVSLGNMTDGVGSAMICPRSRKVIHRREYTPAELHDMRVNHAKREALWMNQRRAKSAARRNARAMGMTGKAYRKLVKKQRQTDRSAEAAK